MSDNDSALYIGAYTKFAQSRAAEKSCTLRILNYDDYKFRSSRPLGVRRFYCDAAEDSTREIANAIHDLRRFTQEAPLWLEVIRNYSEHERFLLTLEFIEIPFAHALSRPYALKNRFTYSLAMLGTMYKARRGREADLKPFEESGYKAAEKLVGDWPGYTALAGGLLKLNSPVFVTASSNFRNCDHHRLPANIEVGLAPGPRVSVRDGVATFSASRLQPIKVIELLPALTEQFEHACACTDLFWTVVSRREDAW
ncbi:MAG: hypothetical protein JWM32_358 [Verrucomicrobia bacterium]|nr:hypothetical protein [Verrucomicrobiota bacterium]